jgi:hypothetical protein
LSVLSAISFTGLFDTTNYRHATVRIPDFQRRYRWQQEHWSELWTDVTQASDHSQDHYFGPLVILDDRPIHATGDVGLIDGQQRITTISIALLTCRLICKALRADDKYTSAGDDIQDKLLDCRHRCKKVLQVRDIGADQGDTSRRLYFDHSLDEKAYKFLFELDALLDGEPTTEKSRLHKAFWWFQTTLVKHIKLNKLEAKFEEKVLKLNAFTYALTQHLVLTEIQVTDESTAFEVFESINHKGERLSATDLLKNRLLKKVADDRRDRAETSANWASFIDSLSPEAECDQSRFSEIDCLYFWWQAHQSDTSSSLLVSGQVRQKKLYNPVKEKLDSEDVDFHPVKFSKTLHEAGATLAKWTKKLVSEGITNKVPHEVGGKYLCPFAMLNTLEYRSPYPYLFRLDKKLPEDLGDRSRIFHSAVNQIIEYLVRHVTITKTKGAEDKLNPLHKVIEDFNPSDGGEELLSEIQERLQEIDMHTGDGNNFVKQKLALTDFVKNNHARFFHVCHWYKEFGGRGSATTLRDFSEIHLEHILPKAPLEHWCNFEFENMGEQMTVKDAEAQDPEGYLDRITPTCINRLGNTCLLLENYNKLARNYSIQDKHQYYKDRTSEPNGTNLETTKEIGALLSDNGCTWTSAEINSRSDKIANYLIDNVFPGTYEPISRE